MKSSKHSGEVAEFQLPFSGLGFSLEACVDAAGEMNVRYSAYPEQDSRELEIFVEPAFTGFSGYELLLTLGREIRGR